MVYARALWRRSSSSEISTFSSLHVRNYRRYLVGQCISMAGTWMQNVAVGWLTLELSGSGAVLGAVMAARFAPMLVLGPWGGLIADRLDNRKLMIGTQVCAGVLSFILAILTLTNVVNLGLLLALVLSLGLVNVFDGPSRQSLLSQLVDRRLVGNAITLNSVAINLSRIVGPGIGGVIIAVVGVGPCFLVNSLSFVAVIVSLLLIRVDELIPAARAPRARGQIRAGWRYVRQTPQLWQPLAMVAATGIFTWEFPVSLPLMTTDVFHQGASAYGTVMAFLGLGALCGGLATARMSSVTTRSLAMASGLWGVPVVAAALAPNLAFELVAIALVGAGAIAFNSAAKTLLQLESAPQMRGRVMALWSMAWQGSGVIGGPIIGAIGAYAGARYALLTGGVVALAVAALFLIPRPGSRAIAATSGAKLDPADSVP